jgi:hypothetical protein
VVLEHTLSTLRVHNAVCYSSCMVLSKGKKKFNSDAQFVATSLSAGTSYVSSCHHECSVLSGERRRAGS